MPGSQHESYSDNMVTSGSARELKSAVPGASTNEIIDRAFREPYYRFLLLMAAIWRNWYWVTPFSLVLSAILGILVYFHSKEKYTSEVWVQVFMEHPYIVFASEQSRGESIAVVYALLQAIYSPPILKDAWLRITEKAREEGIDITSSAKKRDPIRWLSSNIRMNQRGESPVYNVSVTASEPRLAQLILEGIITSYIESVEADSKKRNFSIIENLQVIAELKQKEIDALNREYDSLARTIAIQGGDLPSELNNKIYGIQQNPISMQIITLEAEIAALDIMIKLNRNVLSDESEIPDSEVEGNLYQYPTMQQLFKEKADLKIKLEEYSEKYTSDAAIIRQTNDRLDAIDKQIDKAREELLPDLKDQWRATVRQLAHREILTSEQQIKKHESQIKTLKDANLKNLTREGDTVTIVNKAMEVLTAKNREEQVYTKLMARLGMLKTEMGAMSQVDLISQASFPEFPDGHLRFRQSVMGCVLGFVIPFLLAWGRELSRPRFYHMSQFPVMFPSVSRETVAGLPRSGRESAMSKRQKQAFHFSVDDICNNFCFGRSFAEKHVFLFSSVRNDDGQSLLALSVAERIAQMKKQPVLLIDVHGDSPRLRNLVGVESKASLSDVLAMRLSLNEAIVRDSHQPNLFFLPDGPSQENSAIDLFSDGKFDMLLKELRKHYSTIIISTPPMERSSGSQMMCHFADAVVVALRLYDTPRKNTEKLYERLFEIGKPITSFMISGISAGK